MFVDGVDEKVAKNNVTMSKVEGVDSMLFVTKIIMTGHEDANLAENEVLLRIKHKLRSFTT